MFLSFPLKFLYNTKNIKNQEQSEKIGLPFAAKKWPGLKFGLSKLNRLTRSRSWPLGVTGAPRGANMGVSDNSREFFKPAAKPIAKLEAVRPRDLSTLGY
jgi:hypothetical protein